MKLNVKVKRCAPLAAENIGRTPAVRLFSKLKKCFFGYFDPEFLYEIMKINSFRGEPTDNAAKKEPLDTSES